MNEIMTKSQQKTAHFSNKADQSALNTGGIFTSSFPSYTTWL